MLRKTSFIAVILAVSSVAGVHAQGLATSSIEGQVRSSGGTALFDALIGVVETESGLRRALVSGPDGRFSVTPLPAGRYSLIVEAVGHIPVEVRGIDVGPGDHANVAVVMRAASGAVTTRDVVVASAASATLGSAAPTHWVTAASAAATPIESSGLDALGALDSRFGSDLDAQGLPGSMTDLVVEAVPAITRPSRLGRFVRDASFPTAALTLIRTRAFAVDPEWPASAGAYVTTFMRTGGTATGAAVDAEWSGDVLSGGDVAAFTSIRVGGRLRGSIAPDTALYVIGLEYFRSQTPFAQPWSTDQGTAELLAALPDGLAPIPAASPLLSKFERIAGYARIDLSVGETHQLVGTANVAVLPEVTPVTTWEGPLTAQGTTADAWNVNAMARFVSRLSDGLVNEVDARVEFGHVGRSPDAPTDDVPRGTTVVSAGRSFGARDDRDESEDVRGLYLRETLFADGGDHDLKVGVAIDLPRYEVDRAPDGRGSYIFADVDALGTRTGVFQRTVTDFAPAAEFTFRRFSFFGGDRWQPSPGTIVNAGARLSVTRLPDTVGLGIDREWLRLTGLSNRNIPDRYLVIEPRFSVRWDPSNTGSWLVHGYAQVDGGLIDPALVAEVFQNDGGRSVVRGIGSLGGWPVEPNPGTVMPTGITLSMLGPEFRGPESTRAGASVAVRLGAPTLTLAVDARRTSYLPRRRDLNAAGSPAAVDQNGRPIYGTLTKLGPVLAAVPFSNRRFVEHDAVWAIEATGESRYAGVTAAIEQPLSGNVGLFGSYTFSSTTDDWPAPQARYPDQQLSPFPDSLNGIDWLDARSDFDVPHRLIVGAEVSAPGRFAPRITAIYRFESGRPFTPGFPDGVDVNADGSARNDPAFIDTSLPGMSDVVSAWPCLADFAGGFVERNACRGPNVNALDARLTVAIAEQGGYTAELVADAVNIIASDYGRVDQALLLIDPDTPLASTASTVNVPYTVNPSFGELRTRYAPERLFRIGVRVRY